MTGWYNSGIGTGIAIGAMAFGLFLGIGFCIYLSDKGDAEKIRAQAYADTLRALTLNYDPESSEELKECFQALKELEKEKSNNEE